MSMLAFRHAHFPIRGQNIVQLGAKLTGKEADLTLFRSFWFQLAPKSWLVNMMRTE